jgi:hypothetical protein
MYSSAKNERLKVLTRVTRLVEFSPIGRLFTLGSGLKITEVEHIFELPTFFHGASYAFILSKNGLGSILGDFFTNSSGHPGADIHCLSTIQFLSRFAFVSQSRLLCFCFFCCCSFTNLTY